MRSKNKKIYIGLTFIMLVASLTFMVKYRMVNANSEDKQKIILIDPGHGGMDGGAVSINGTVEKNINLMISLELKNKLEKEGYKVLMTREEDKGLYNDNTNSIRGKKIEDLNNRCKMKKESNCDIFISIHLNKFPQSKYYGAQVWYSNREDSKILAKIIQDNFKEELDDTNRRVEKPAKGSYKVLRDNDSMASVLIECGFLSNSQEELKLKSKDYQIKIAEIISKSIKNFHDKP